MARDPQGLHEEDGRGDRPDEGAPLTAVSSGRLPRAAAATAAAALLLLLPGHASARDDGSGPGGGAYVTKEQRIGIDAALGWIHHAMNPGGKWGRSGPANTDVADTALSVLALMAGGNTLGPGAPDRDGHVGGPTLRGQYAADVRDGIDFLARLALVEREDGTTGYVTDGDGSQMHGHGFATLALATACAGLGASPISAIRESVKSGVAPASMSYADRVRMALENAVRLTERAQDKDTGGWYYWPIGEGHEGSMTVTQVTALRAASESGVAVNGTVMKKAYEYLRRSQNQKHRDLVGGFAYKIDDPSNVSIGLTAASLTTLFGIGRYGELPEDAEIIEKGLKFIDRRFEDEAFDVARKQFFYYRVFYLAQAVYLSGDEMRRRNYLPKIREQLLNLQQADGGFRGDGVNERERSPEYCTAIACLTLETPLETLPIFQRR